MTSGQAAAADTAKPGSAEDLIEAAFTQIKKMGADEQSLRLFPNGVGSLEIEIGSGPDVRVSLKISGAAAATAIDEAALASTGIDTDVHVTFNAEGHHIVALIAQRDLQQHFPATWRKVQKILDDGHRDLDRAATFPDDIRISHPETKVFHFIDIPFKDGGPVNPSLPLPPHALSKIADSTAELKQAGATAEVRVDALSWLIHLIGDIHQPLHCTDHISDLHPAGDRGGNSFKLKGKARNLHSLWDSSTDFSNQQPAEVVDSIMAEHARSSLATDLQVTNVETWARASFALAKKFAYAPLHENPAAPPQPSAAYLKTALKIGRRQAALAGYRLADRFRTILG